MNTAISFRQIIFALEGSAANTDTDPRWIAATALRQMSGWENRTMDILVESDAKNAGIEEAAQYHCNANVAE